MTKQEAITDLKILLRNIPKFVRSYQSISMGIEALEQGDVLQEIRDEITNLVKTYPFTDHIDAYVKEDEVLEIIDKKMKEIADETDN